MKRRFFKLTQKALIVAVLFGLIVPTVAMENKKPTTGSVTINYKNAETGQQILSDKGLPISESMEVEFDKETPVKAKDIEGFDVIGNNIKYTTVTKDKPNAIVTFSYAPKTSSENKKVEIVCKDEKGNYIQDPVITDNVSSDAIDRTPPKITDWTHTKTDNKTEDGGNTEIITHTYKYTGTAVLPEKATISIEYKDAKSNELIKKTTQDGIFGLNKIKFEDLEGYTIVPNTKTDYYASYKTPQITVQAKYNKVEKEMGKVTINKQLEDGTPIGTEVQQIPFDTPTEIVAPKTEGYKVTGLTSKKVTLTKEQPTATIVFTYVEAENGKITVKYLDKATNKPISEPTVVNVDRYGEHSVKAKSIKGYTLNGKESQTVTLSKQQPNAEVTFLYDKIPDPTHGTLTINYINQVDGRIIDSDKLDNVPFGPRTYKAKEIKGYQIVETGTKTVTLSVEQPTATVSFLYKPIPTGGGTITPDDNNPKPQAPVKGKVTIRYMDTEGNALSAPEVYENLQEGEYTYKAKSFDGYTLQSNSSISFSINKDNLTKEIEFIYRKNVVDGKINISFVDNNTGESIMPSQTYGKLSNGIYSYRANEISGYKLVGPNKLSVEISANNPIRNIVFKYEKLLATTGDTVTDVEGAGAITIKYIDTLTGTELKQAVVHNGLAFKEYLYSAIDIEGYKLVGDVDRKITLSEDNPTQELTFEYQKTDASKETVSITTEEPGKNNSKDKNESLNEKKSLPLGLKIAVGVGAVAFVVLVASVLISTISSKRKARLSSADNEDDDFLDDDI